MLLLTLRGTPTLYYGDEIGMHDVPIPPELVQDPCEKNVPGLGLGRDPERTPMQWNGAPHAGFTTATRGCRSPTTTARPTWRRSARPRVDAVALPPPDRAARRARAGDRHLRAGGRGGRCAGVRPRAGGRRFLVALNLGSAPASLSFDGAGERVLSTDAERRPQPAHGRVDLRGDEGVVVHLS